MIYCSLIVKNAIGGKSLQYKRNKRLAVIRKYSTSGFVPVMSHHTTLSLIIFL